MTAATARDRSDPFALPATTTVRFALLVAAVAGTGLFAYDYLYLAFGTTTPDGSPCTVPLTECVAPYGAAAAGWMLGGLALLFTVAWLVFLAMPTWMIRRDGLRPLNPDDSPDLMTLLAVLVHEAGVRTAPTFLVDTRRERSSGCAFGGRGQYFIRLDGGLLTRFTTDRAVFVAVVRHELAHLRNRDVDIATFTMAVWYAFLVVALLPLVATMVRQPGWYLVEVGWRVAALTVAVLSIRHAVLRTREHYADARAFRWDGPGGAMVRFVVETGPRPWWRMSTHPDGLRRRRVLADPSLLLRPNGWDAFGAGAVSTVAVSGLTTLLVILAGRPNPFAVRWFACLAFAVFVAVIVGLIMWRSALCGRPSGVVRVGLGLGAGMLAGVMVALPSALSGFWGTQGVPGIGTAAALLALLPLGTLVVVAWTAHAAEVWHPPPPWPRMATAVLSTAAGLALLMAYWFLLHDLHPVLDQATRDARADHTALLTGPLPVGPYALWAVHGHGFALHAVHQDSVAVCLGLLVLGPALALRRWTGWAVSWGVAAGAGYAVLLLALRAFLHSSYTSEERSTPVLLLVFDHWQVTAAIAAQATVASVVTVTRPRGMALGAVAAVVTGLVAVAAMLGTGVLGGCVPQFSLRHGPCAWNVPGDVVGLTLRRVLVPGLLTAVVIAPMADVVDRCLRAMTGWPVRPRGAHSHRKERR